MFFGRERRRKRRRWAKEGHHFLGPVHGDGFEGGARAGRDAELCKRDEWKKRKRRRAVKERQRDRGKCDTVTLKKWNISFNRDEVILFNSNIRLSLYIMGTL